MNWLFKEEPSNYSFDELVKDKKTVWSGVKNPVAQRNLRSVKKGDQIFFYHTGDENRWWESPGRSGTPTRIPPTRPARRTSSTSAR